VRDRVAVPIETDVRLLTEADRPDQRGLEGVGRPREEHALLLGEDLGYRLVPLVRMAALMRDGVAPLHELRAEIVEIAERPRGEEGMPQVLNLALDLPFGESCRLLLMRGLRNESFASPTPSTR
jgi:hypothetical protein